MFSTYSVAHMVTMDFNRCSDKLRAEYDLARKLALNPYFPHSRHWYGFLKLLKDNPALLDTYRERQRQFMQIVQRGRL